MKTEDDLQRLIPERVLSTNNKPYRLILGECPYPNRNDIINSMDPIYSKLNGEVAILSTSYKFPMFAILSILCNSHDSARNLIDGIYKNPNLSMQQLADYLLHKHHIIFANRYDASNNSNAKTIVALCNSLPIDKVLILGKNRVSLKMLKQFAINNIQYNVILHPSPRAYSRNSGLWCELYLHFNDQSLSNVKFIDFML